MERLADYLLDFLLRRLDNLVTGRGFCEKSTMKTLPTAFLVTLGVLVLATGRTKAGFLFVSNSGNNTITQVDASGNATIFATTGVSVPQGLGFDSSGNLYVANSGTNTIAEYSPTGAFLSYFVTSGILHSPRGLAFDSSGNLYVADAGGNSIDEF
jgi:DNA-binding beta-propeller fold protein YncE